MPHYNFTEVTILYRESVPKRWEIKDTFVTSLTKRDKPAV